MTRRAILAIGGNLGDRAANLAGGAAKVAAIPGVRLVAVSRLYETPALTLEGIDVAAPRYLNAALRLELDDAVTPRQLLDEARAIEDEAGRQRAIRWGSRTLDLDIVDIDGIELRDRILTVPHPEAWRRAFVLAPWHDVEPDAQLPGRGRVEDLLAAAADEVEPVGRLAIDPRDGTVRAEIDPRPSPGSRA